MRSYFQGPENPYGDRNRSSDRNALVGHVEERSMSDYAFRQQYLTHSILGYSANPSVDPNGHAIIGPVEVVQANGFATLGSIKTTTAKEGAEMEMESSGKPWRSGW